MNTIATVTEITINTEPVRTKNAKPVLCISDGKVYASGIDAAIAYGLHFTNISQACRGKIKTTGGRQFCFVEDVKAKILDVGNTIAKANKERDEAIAESNKAKAEASTVIRAELERNQDEKRLVELIKKRKAIKENIAREQEALRLVEEAIAALDI